MHQLISFTCDGKETSTLTRTKTEKRRKNIQKRLNGWKKRETLSLCVYDT